MINNYETMYIIRPDITEDQVSQEVKKYEDFLNSRGAESIKIQNHGKKRLAYTIHTNNNKHNDGIYVQMNYRIDGSVIDSLQREMRISENVIRFLTLKVENPPEVAAKPEPATEVASRPEPETETEATETTEAAAEQAAEEMISGATEEPSPTEETSQ